MTESYYPPRAHWYSPLWNGWYRIRRRLYLDRVPKFASDAFYRGMLGAVLPGWALIWTGQRVLGLILGLAYFLSGAVFLGWLGYPISNFALTAMISIHAGSILRVPLAIGFWKRIVYSIFTFLVVTSVVYIPLRNWMQKHWMMPLTINGQVIVIRTGRQPDQLKLGDCIAYNLQRIYIPGVLSAAGGCTLGRVLALPGDEVSFGPQAFSVNGVTSPRLDRMPTNGTMRIQQNCWFIWPEVHIRGEQYASGADIAGAMMQLAIVPESSYVGVPFRRWLWRRQTVP